MTISGELEVRDSPGDAEVRAALERIISSDIFRSSPQLGAFLRFIVAAALNGQGATLKGYTIGVEALGRDQHFDPQIDPIVRVEATRLRRALDRYYGGPGADDPVCIEMPRGTYAPTFSRRTALQMPASAGAKPLSPRRSWLRSFLQPSAVPGMPPRAAFGILALAGVVLLISLALFAIGGTSVDFPQASTGADTRPSTTTGLPYGNGMPTIYIEPLRVVGTPEPTAISATSLLEKIEDGFARFDTINVAHDQLIRDSVRSSRGRPSIGPSRADYRLSALIEYGASTTKIVVQLIDNVENNIAWSRTFESTLDRNRDAAEEAIVTSLTDALLQSYGVIRARDRAKHLTSPTGDPRYRCILEAADSFRTINPVGHERARNCLETLTSADPSFSVGFEFLALLYYREYMFDLGVRPGDPPALDRALRMARRAIELSPASSRAYLALFVVQYARHDVAAAFATADKALALNKYDMLTIAEYGGRLIMTGEVAHGLAMMKRAGESGGIRPSWHHFYLFLGNYLSGDMKAAAFEADQITTDNYPLGLVAKAISATASGHQDQALWAANKLIEVQPAWRDPRKALEKSIYQPEIVDRLARDLAMAGLSSKS